MKKLGKSLLLMCLCTLSVFSIVGCSNGSDKDTIKIGLVQFMEHPSLDTIRKATVKELKELGYEDKENVEIIYKNGEGDANNLDTICSGFKDEGVDVIIAIATPAAQAAANYATDIPVIFSAVSDPVGAKLVDDAEKPSNNITGTSDEVQVDQIIDLALKMYPDTKSVGYLYNSGESNSVSNLEKLKAYADKKGLEVIEGSVTNTSDVNDVTANLCAKADIIFSPTDNTVASAMDIVKEVTIKNKTPMFTGADSMVNDGGLATIGINYENLGKETAKMAAKVLEGTDVKEIPVKVFKEDLNVYLNTTTAEAIGFAGIDAIKEAYKNVIEVK